MRKFISNWINKKNNNSYFLHADMWNNTRFPIKNNIINCGLGEANLLNIAGGLASQGKTVYIYGVCGFIIHRLEQLKFSCKYFGANYGKIIICNAGKIGYENLGIGHKLDDDFQIMEMLDIPFKSPSNINMLKEHLEYIKKQNNGIWYIQLGKDYE